MTQSIWYRKEIASYRATASACTRRAERYAKDAAEYYQRAKGFRDQADWLARRAGWREIEQVGTPAEWEKIAATHIRIADKFLDSSNRETERAAYYRDLAARYVQMAADRDASYAELMAGA